MSERRLQPERVRSAAAIARRLVRDAIEADALQQLMQSLPQLSPAMAFAITTELNRRKEQRDA
jgi:hypothetical protein